MKARRSGTTYQELNVEKQRSIILRLIQKFRGLQAIFMPNLREYLSTTQLRYVDTPASFLPEATKLYLPSQIPSASRDLSRCCVPGLVDAETRLREGEARDALESMRKGLRMCSAGHLFKIRNVSGQNPTTRAEGLQRKIQVNIHLDKLKYQWARNALYQLRGHGAWEIELQVLKDEHVRGLTERLMSKEESREHATLQAQGIIDELINTPENEDAVVFQGESKRLLSWIWYSYPVGSKAVAEGKDSIDEGT